MILVENPPSITTDNYPKVNHEKTEPKQPVENIVSFTTSELVVPPIFEDSIKSRSIEFRLKKIWNEKFGDKITYDELISCANDVRKKNGLHPLSSGAQQWALSVGFIAARISHYLPYLYPLDTEKLQLLKTRSKITHKHSPLTDSIYKIHPFETINFFDKYFKEYYGDWYPFIAGVSIDQERYDLIRNICDPKTDNVPIPEAQTKDLKILIEGSLNDDFLLSLFFNQLCYGTSASTTETNYITFNMTYDEITEQLKLRTFNKLYAINLLKTIRNCAKKNDVILDLGTGYGTIPHLIRQATEDLPGIRIYATDINHLHALTDLYAWNENPISQLLESGKNEYFNSLPKNQKGTPPQFIQSGIFNSGENDIGCIPFADNSISIITLSSVLRHMPIEHGSIITKEIERVLKPGGIVIVDEKQGIVIFEKSTEHV